MGNGGTRMFLLGAFAAGAGMIVACAALFLIYNIFQMVQTQTNNSNAMATAAAEAIRVRAVQTQSAVDVDATRRAATSTPAPTATPVPSATPLPTATPPPTATPTLTPAPTATSTPRPLPTATPTFPVNWFSGYTTRELNRRQVQVDVDYFYNGEWGTNNIMVAGLGMTSTGRVFEVNSSAMPIAPGVGHATVTLEIGVPGEWHISKVEMCIYQKDSTEPHSYCQEFPLIKTFWMPTPKP